MFKSAALNAVAVDLAATRVLFGGGGMAIFTLRTIPIANIQHV